MTCTDEEDLGRVLQQLRELLLLNRTTAQQGDTSAVESKFKVGCVFNFVVPAFVCAFAAVVLFVHRITCRRKSLRCNPLRCDKNIIIIMRISEKKKKEREGIEKIAGNFRFFH